MRLKLLTLALVSALVAASAAIASDHPGKGPKPKSGDGCKPAVTVMLAGVLAGDVDPQDGDASFVLTVQRSNRHGRRPLGQSRDDGRGSPAARSRPPS